jgi:hypothetical protein
MNSILQHGKTFIVIIAVVLNQIFKTSVQKSELLTAFTITLHNKVHQIRDGIFDLVQMIPLDVNASNIQKFLHIQ